MADQIERLIEAVKDVSRYMTRLSTYSHLISMGLASTAVSSAVSATLGSLLKAVQLIGTLTGASTLTGGMTVIPAAQLDGLITAITSASGNINISKQLAGIISAASAVTTSIMNSVQLAGSSAAASGGSAYILNAVQLSGVVTCYTVTGHAEM